MWMNIPKKMWMNIPKKMLINDSHPPNYPRTWPMHILIIIKIICKYMHFIRMLECFHNSSEKKGSQRLKMANMREPRTMTMKGVAVWLPLVLLPSPLTRLLPPSHSHPSISSPQKINFGSAKFHPLAVQAHRGRQRQREVLCPNLRIPGNNSRRLKNS